MFAPQVTHNLQVSDGDNGLMLLRDQIVIQIGEELDGMVMIRSGDNRQGVCPVKFLQEVWQHSEVACQADYTCTCLNRTQQPVINKIYYPNPSAAILQNNNNNNVWVNTQTTKKNLNSSNIFQYYYNNINNNLTKNNALFVKQINLNNNDYPNLHSKNEHKNLHTKAPFSSSKRPLSIRLSTLSTCRTFSAGLSGPTRKNGRSCWATGLSAMFKRRTSRLYRRRAGWRFLPSTRSVRTLRSSVWRRRCTGRTCTFHRTVGLYLWESSVRCTQPIPYFCKC